MSGEGVTVARKAFDRGRPGFLPLAARFVDDPDAVVDAAAERYEAMLPTMAYVDRPRAPMAGAVFSCSASLALYLTLAERGVDVHDYGRTMLELMANRPAAEEESPDPSTWLPWFTEGGEESKRENRPGEFVYEVVRTDDDGSEIQWGMNILSCAICFQFSRYDAMALVPYMCATDDVESDRSGLGLRRTGSIGVGAHRCDFRYEPGGESHRLAEQYPDKIRIPVAPE